MTRYDDRFRAARTCYDHLAGRLGVAVTDALLDRWVIRRDTRRFIVTEKGNPWLRGFGIDVGVLASQKRPLTRACMDLTERKDHLAGALGAAIVARLLELGWIERRSASRTVRLTPAGRAGLAHTLDLDQFLEEPARGD